MPEYVTDPPSIVSVVGGRSVAVFGSTALFSTARALLIPASARASALTRALARFAVRPLELEKLTAATAVIDIKTMAIRANGSARARSSRTLFSTFTVNS